MATNKLPEMYNAEQLRDELLLFLKNNARSPYGLAREIGMHPLTMVRLINGDKVSLATSMKLSNWLESRVKPAQPAVEA
jgi:plasmid maintenance system antidote protein VapI